MTGSAKQSIAPLAEAWIASLEMRCWLRQSNPTGKSAEVRPALRTKIFRLTCRANQWFNSARLTQSRGGSRSSRTCGGMRWTRKP